MLPRLIFAGCVALAPLMAPAAATAQMATPAPCVGSATNAPLPAALSAWSKRSPVTAAAGGKGADAATLAIGIAVDATLTQTGKVTYVMRPEKPGGSVSYGGLFTFAVAQPGTYRVALGSGAWIDVLSGPKPVPSTAHGHGPTCSGIRKMVDFSLKPGRYTLQITANGSAQLPLLVTRLP